MPCCHEFSKKMGNNLEAIMRVMRFANGRGKIILLKKFMQDFKKFSKYNLNDTEMFGQLESDYTHTIIPKCDLKQSEEVSSRYATRI